MARYEGIAAGPARHTNPGKPGPPAKNLPAYFVLWAAGQVATRQPQHSEANRDHEVGRVVISISALIGRPQLIRACGHGRQPVMAAASRPGPGAAPPLPAANSQSEGTEGSTIAGAGVDPLAAIARSRRRRSTASKWAGLVEHCGIVCCVSKLRLGYVMSDV